MTSQYILFKHCS